MPFCAASVNKSAALIRCECAGQMLFTDRLTYKLWKRATEKLQCAVRISWKLKYEVDKQFLFEFRPSVGKYL